jgi:hypothetical protein
MIVQIWKDMFNENMTVEKDGYDVEYKHKKQK